MMAKSLYFVVNLFSSSYSLMKLVVLWRMISFFLTKTVIVQHCRQHACHNFVSEPRGSPSVAG